MSIAQTIRFIVGHPLGRTQPFVALGRFARWQISSRLGFGPMLVPFVGDSKLLVSSGMTGATGNIYVGLHEFHDMGFFLHFLRSDDLFLDVGANVGSYTVLAAKGVGASCITIEPVPATFHTLETNLRVNRVEDRVDARCVAVGAEEGSLRFSTDLDCTNKAVDDTYTGTSVHVPVHQLDRVVDGRTPAAIKIDVEGFERAVLAGAARTLASPSLRAVIMETEDPESSNEMTARQTLIAAGFLEYAYDATTRQLSRKGSSSARAPFGNYLFLRDPEFVHARVKSAARYRLGPWNA